MAEIEKGMILANPQTEREVEIVDSVCYREYGKSLDMAAEKEKLTRASKATEGSAVDHPQHYGGAYNQYEAIKVIEAWGLDRDFCLGSVLKYLCRQGKKDREPQIQELEKALWYLKRKIENLKQNPVPTEPGVQV